MDVRFLTTFLEVVETRHFGHAAENLFLTQSAVSARIKLLEEYFNTVLFIRNRNSIQITPAGEKLIPFARDLSETLANAKKRLAEEECQHINCASSQKAFLLYFSDLMPELIHQFSSVSFRHEIASSEQLSRQIHEHSIDFALSTSKLKSDDIDDVLLFEVPLAIFKSKNQDAEEQKPAHFINIEWATNINEQLYQLYPDFRKAKLRTSSIDVALSLARQEPSVLALPISELACLDKSLKQILSECEASHTALDIKVPVYLHILNKTQNQVILDIVQYLQQR